MSGSYAPHVVPFKWHIPLSQIIPKIVYNEGTAVSDISGNNINLATQLRIGSILSTRTRMLMAL